MAQTNCIFQISGNIADADTKEPLPFATILIVETKVTTYSDTNGYYLIKNICSGEYTIRVSHFSCEPLQFKVRINQNNLLFNIVLPHKTNELREVTITEKHKEYNTSVKEELKQERLFLYKGLTIGEMLQHINGVQTIQTGNNIFKPVVSGLHSNRLQIVNNGVRLESQQWGIDHAPEIDPIAANKITIIKGAGALRYGSDALAGTIITESKPLPFGSNTSSELFTSFFSNNNMFAAYAMVEKNLKQLPSFSWRLNLSTRKGGNAKTPSYHLWNTGVEDINAAITLGFRKPNYNFEFYSSVFTSTIGIFLGSQIGNIADLQETIKAQTPLFNKNEFSYQIARPRQEILHQTNKLKYTYFKDPRHLLHLQLSLQQNIRKEYDLAMISSKPELNLMLMTAQKDVWYEHKYDYWMHTYGIAITWQENQWSGSRFFIPNYRNFIGSAYHISAFSKNKINAEAGLRFDYRNLTTYRNNNGIVFNNNKQWQNLSATSNLHYAVNKKMWYALNISIAWRPPSVNELYVNGLHHGTSSFEIGNSNMHNETGIKTGFQLTKVFGDSFFILDAYLYNHYINGFINLVPDTPPTLTIRGAYPTFKYNQTNANLSGVDFSVKIYPLKHTTYQIMTSVLYAKNIITDDWLQQMPSNRISQQLTFAFPGILKNNNLILNIQYNTVFKQSRIPAFFVDYLPPPPTYNLCNMYAATTIKNLQIQFGVNNLFNTAYREYLNRFRYFNNETGRNIFIRLLFKFNHLL